MQTQYITQSNPLGEGYERGVHEVCIRFSLTRTPSSLEESLISFCPKPVIFPLHRPKQLATPLFPSCFDKLLFTLLASYDIGLKIFVCRSWKYGLFVPIFAPLRKGGTAETAMTSGRKEQDLQRLRALTIDLKKHLQKIF